MAPNQPKTNRFLLELDRLVFLIDGVFAITLTLLVLDLKLPVGSTGSLAVELRELLPRLAIYLFAFTVIANQWSIHHMSFRLVYHADNNLVLLSLVNLLFITLIPASASIVGGHPFEPGAAAIFTVNLLLLCLSAWAVWAYVAANSHLLAENTDVRVLKGIGKVWLFVSVGFVLSLIAGQFSVILEYALWVLWSPLVSIWWARERNRIGGLI
jgi:uncharacterized membrane protein